MPTESDGLHIVITGDASQAIKEIQKTQQATEALKDQSVDVKVDAKVDALGRLHKANGQFMTMGEKLAAQFSSGFMKGFAELSVKLDGWGKNLEATFGSAFKSITAGATAVAGTLSMIAKNALALGGGFEAQMTTVSVISGATADELAQLTAKAREMGATLPITAKDAAMAMTVLAQRGTSAKDILASVADVANLTISQGVSMGQAADLLGSTLTNFGMKIEEASKVTAIFNNAALNMGKLTEALKYVGPAAGSIGMELTEAVAGMEALANAGLTGEMTGTGFAMVLTKLASKSRIMGVETRDLQGKIRPLADIFSELQAKGFSLAQATAEFGARGRLAALNLAKQSASLKENEERLKNWGSTQAAVDSKAKTFTNTMAAFRSAVEELHIEIFDQIKDKAKGVVGTFAELTRTFAAWVGQSKIAEKALQAFLEGLGFNIPAADVQAFVDRVRDFGKAIQSIASVIASFANKVKTPLLFLIEHLDTFATISFWGWILGKGLQIPAAIISIAGAFKQLEAALKALAAVNFAAIFSKLATALSNSSILGFLTNPAVAAVAVTGMALHEVVRNVNEASSALFKAQNEEKRYMQEQAQANFSLPLDIKFNVKTGFEKLPESWTKASDELRAKANETVDALRSAFTEKVAGTIDAVAAKFPDMADALKAASQDLSFSALSQLTKALQGNKEAFDALPPHMQKVAEQLYITGVQAGQTEGSLRKILRAAKEAQSQLSSYGSPQQSEVSVFAQELAASLNSITAAVPDNVERLQKFLSSDNLDLAVNISVEQAQAQLQELSKSVAEKFNLPADIVSSELFSRLQELAIKGNDTAQSLVHGWKGAGNSIDTFLASAQEAISYLGASPDKFMPALNSLTASIQKFDPLTGKVTEQFKKAHDALKQWANVTFDQLAQRIQRLRKAVEGGFIDQSALEAEFKRASQQVKIQIAAELEPSRSQFNSREAFNSVVASEYVSRMGELGGNAFMDLVQREFQGLYDKSGSAIGAAIMHEVNKGLASGNASIKINGVEMLTQEKGSNGAIDYSNLQKAFTDAVNPFVAKLEQFTQKQDNNSHAYLQNAVDALLKLTAAINNSSGIIGRANDVMLSFTNSVVGTKDTASGTVAFKDYSSDFSNVVKEIQAVSAGITALQTSAQANIAAVNSVASAVAAQQFDTSAISQAVVAGFNPVVSRLDAQASVSANVSRNLEGLIRATDNNSQALASLQSALASAGSSGTSSESFSRALAPLISSVGSLAASVAGLQSINQNITSAVRDIENAVKSLSTGNNYDIDIIQQGFSVEKKSDADLVARNVASALRSGLGNGGV